MCSLCLCSGRRVGTAICSISFVRCSFGHREREGDLILTRIEGYQSYILESVAHSSGSVHWLAKRLDRFRRLSIAIVYDLVEQFVIENYGHLSIRKVRSLRFALLLPELIHSTHSVHSWYRTFLHCAMSFSKGINNMASSLTIITFLKSH